MEQTNPVIAAMLADPRLSLNPELQQVAVDFYERMAVLAERLDDHRAVGVER